MKQLFRFSSINFNFVSNLPETLIPLQESIADFCRTEIQPLAKQADANNAFPNQLWPVLGQMGLLGITTPSAYGGSELSYTAHCVAMEEISRYSGSIGLSYGAHTALCVGQVERWGNEAQKQEFLPGLCNGSLIGCLAMSEPGSGSDVVSMRTRAKKTDGGWVINGGKMWITNGPDAHVMVIYAKTEWEGKEGITCFLVKGDSKGLERGKKLEKLGMRGSNTCELSFDNMFVPDEYVMGDINKGVYVLMSGLDYERLILAAGPVGLMQGCMDQVIPYVQQREQFKNKIGNFQLMQGKLADMFVKLQSTRGYMYSLSQAIDNTGNCSNADCAGVLLFASLNANEVANEAIQAFGGNGYTKDYEVERIFRDAKLYDIGAGTNEIRRWLIGREIMKHNA